MRTGRPKVELVLTISDHEKLEELAWGDLQPAVSGRAKIVLLCAEGLSNLEVARELGVSTQTVGKWRRRFITAGMRRLRKVSRRGGRRPISSDRVDAVVAIALEPNPAGCAPVSTRRIAEEIASSHTSVHRILRSYGIQRHRRTAFDVSADLPPIEKVWDLVGLFLKPPVNVMVVCVDEHSQLVATKVWRPPRRARRSPDELAASKPNHDLLPSEAIEAIANAVIQGRSAVQLVRDYSEFLARIDDAVPEQLDVHLVADDFAPHKAGQIRDWMFKRPRFQLHVVPTHDSWLDQVDRWFEMSLCWDPTVGEHGSVASLKTTSMKFLAADDDPERPFIWTKPANAIKATIARLTSTPGHQ